MRTTWREAWECLWETFSGVRCEGSARAWRSGAFLALALGCARVLWEEGGRNVPAPPSAPSSPSETERVQELLRDAHRVMEARSVSTALGRSSRSRRRDLFGAAAPEPPAQDIPSEVPGVVLRAIMTLGGDRVAVADIPGVGAGLILRVEDRLLGGRVRVLRISERGILLRWDGADIAFGF